MGENGPKNKKNTCVLFKPNRPNPADKNEGALAECTHSPDPPRNHYDHARRRKWLRLREVASSLPCMGTVVARTHAPFASTTPPHRKMVVDGHRSTFPEHIPPLTHPSHTPRTPNINLEQAHPHTLPRATPRHVTLALQRSQASSQLGKKER